MIHDLEKLLEVTPLSLTMTLKDGRITMSGIPLKQDTTLPPFTISGTADDLNEPGAITEQIEAIRQLYIKKGVEVSTEDLQKEEEAKPASKTAAKKTGGKVQPAKAAAKEEPETEEEEEDQPLSDEEITKKLPADVQVRFKQILSNIAKGSYIAATADLNKMIAKVKGAELINGLQAKLDLVKDLQKKKEEAAKAAVLGDASAEQTTAEDEDDPFASEPVAEVKATAKVTKVSENEEVFEELKPIKPNPKAAVNAAYVPTEQDLTDDEENPFND